MIYKEYYGKIYRYTSQSNVLVYICEADDDIAKWEQKMADAGARKATVEEMLSIGDDVKQTGYDEPILMPDDEEKFEKLNEDEGYPDLPMDILPDMPYSSKDKEPELTNEELSMSVMEDLLSLQDVVVADDDHCLS
jgi:hypothetical protein